MELAIIILTMISTFLFVAFFAQLTELEKEKRKSCNINTLRRMGIKQNKEKQDHLDLVEIMMNMDLEE